jgi:hypothetical protein
VKSALLAILLWQAAATPWVQTADPHYLRYERSVSLSTTPGQTCAVIDASVFTHAAASLKDIRLYQGIAQQRPQEVPYAITLSEPIQPDSAPARILNLGTRNGSTVFDLQMPTRTYTEVTLNLAGQDYVATATVSGSNTPGAADTTSLGQFTLFDLTSQHLSHSTTLHLQESSFPYLHIALTSVRASSKQGTLLTPQTVLGATVPPSRDAQSLYTTAAETTAITQHGRQSIATFSLPQRVPVERITFDVAPSFKANFSRDVHLYDRPEGTSAFSGENVSGTIQRVHLVQMGREIRQEQLSIPATIGSNLQSPATVEVVIENGDDPPLPITAIRLEMRQRNLCFDATTQPLTLFYGDPTLATPQYDYARLFSPTAHTSLAQLGPEQFNPAYRPRPDTRPLTERHPDLLWIALLISVCSLAFVAIHSARTFTR